MMVRSLVALALKRQRRTMLLLPGAVRRRDMSRPKLSDVVLKALALVDGDGDDL
jgi:hypothetical protein